MSGDNIHQSKKPQQRSGDALDELLDVSHNPRLSAQSHELLKEYPLIQKEIAKKWATILVGCIPWRL